jgi:hypothetical protein
MDNLIEADLNEALLPARRQGATNARHGVVHTRRTLLALESWRKASFVYLFGLITATLFSPLQARYSRPSGFATMFRTTPHHPRTGSSSY